MNLSKISLLLSLAVTGVFSLGQARADLQDQYFWANGESYAAFTLGNGLGNSSLSNTNITGDIGVDGNQTMFVDPSDTINGNTYVAPGSQVSGSATYSGVNSGPTEPSGNHRQMTGSSEMSTQETNLYNASTTFSSNAFLTANPSTNATSSNKRLFAPSMQNLNLTGGANVTLTTSGTAAFNLSTFTMANSTLTLDGNGNSNAAFVFNISSSFALSNSHIVLQDGLTAGNVIFNITGTSPANAGEGTAGYYSLFDSTLSGSILSPYRTVSLINSQVTGTVVGERILTTGTTGDLSSITQSPASN